MSTNQNTQAKKVTYEVKGGPSKDRLFDAVKYVYEKDSIPLRFGVIFDTVAPGNCFRFLNIHDIRVTGITHESGSGDKFNLTGYCKMTFSPMTTESSHLHEKPFKMFYDAHDRVGTITFDT